MEADGFVAKLKVTGGQNDFCDLSKGYDEYKKILAKLPAKERISFSLNVLCILCRNLDKVPSWRDRVNIRDLLSVSIDCVRETRPAQKPDRVKALACITHMHKFVVKQTAPIPPELLLKLSYMPFEVAAEDMLPEYSKTYWNILGDRIAYLERLKGERRAIVKLLPKLIEDYDKVLRICDSVYFCQTVLVFLVKKLYYLFTDSHAKELNNSYKAIFAGLSTKGDLKRFKNLSEKETMEIYVKFNECFYTIMENSSKTKFNDSIFYELVRTCISIVGHRSDLFHCLQTFYLNSFCNLLMDRVNGMFTETILSGMKVSCETTEKLSYKEAMMATYPFIYQLLRLYIEFSVSNGDKLWKETFTVETQESCLKLVLFLMGKLKYTNQMLKCDNCPAKTGLHDSLRLSFPIKNAMSLSLSHEMDLTAVLPVYLSIVEKQHEVLSELEGRGCRNHTKCLQKVQTDIHNTAILLHRAKNYSFSIETFNIYLKQEIKLHRTEGDFKNISRGFYNKAICELDSKLHEESMKSAYLSLLFSQPEALPTDKHISLVIDVKAKLIKAKQPNESQEVSQDHLQQFTVADVFKTCLTTDLYGDLQRFFANLKLSQMLKHEFKVYAKLWPSIGPIAGVWAALYDMVENPGSSGIPAEDESSILSTLYDVILETPHVVRTIHDAVFRKTVLALLVRLENVVKVEKIDKAEKLKTKSKSDVSKETAGKRDQSSAAAEGNGENVLVYATLLFLKSEFDLAEASVKYGWKIAEPSNDPDLASSSRTIPQEHAALLAAATAVELLTSQLPLLMLLGHSRRVVPALRQWCPHIPLLLSAGRHAHALQLARIVCQLADAHNDRESYTQAAGAILSLARGRSPALEQKLSLAGRHAESLLAGEGTLQAALVFVCEAAIYSAACGSPGAAARLLQFAQARLLEASETRPGLNLDLAVGRLLDAQTALCAGAGPGAAVWAQRHYLAVANTASQWTQRRQRGLYTKLHATEAGILATGRCRALLLWRRARSSCCAALQSSGAVDAARLLATVTCVHKTDEAQVKIDNRLKYILGLQPTNETQPARANAEQKPNATPRARPESLETMLDAQMFRRTQTSPSVPCTTVPPFRMPEFMCHGEVCECYACQTPFCFILACQTAGLEASVYFRAKEIDIAKHYFHGALSLSHWVDTKLKHVFNNYRKLGFESYVVEIVERILGDEFRKVMIDILIEAAFFELSQRNYQKADEFIVRIHEIQQESPAIDQYTQNEVMNLMCAAAYMRKIIRSPDADETGLETELENLKLSPNAKTQPEIQKTPESKAEKPPKTTRTKICVKDEEMPTLKRKVIKLNLDDAEDESTPATCVTKRPTRKQTQFKIPVPITSKPVPETITPLTKAKTRPKILITQPTIDLPTAEDLATPGPSKKRQGREPSTPMAATTPAISEDVFFTPMTSVKTYAKKSLRKDIVKNLDKEFSTPKTEEKENTSTQIRSQRSRRKVETATLRSLRRSTSPGDLSDEPGGQKKVDMPVRPKLRAKNFEEKDDKKK